MLLLKRLLATLVDIILFLAAIVGLYVFILPFVTDLVDPMVFAALSLVAVVVINFAAQYPFWQVHQTIGKAFFRLKVISTNDQRPLTTSIMFQREVFAKAFTCYFMCLPVLFNSEGQHDIVCETEVIEL